MENAPIVQLNHVNAMSKILHIDRNKALEHFNKAGTIKDQQEISEEFIFKAFKRAGYMLQRVESKSITKRFPGIHASLKHMTVNHTKRFKKYFTEEDTYFCLAKNHAIPMIKGIITKAKNDNSKTRIDTIYRIFII